MDLLLKIYFFVYKKEPEGSEFSVLNSGCLIFRGPYNGDMNLLTIPPGIYSIHARTTVENYPAELSTYSVFIQYPYYNTQEIIAANGRGSRNYTGSSPVWTEWNLSIS